MSDDKAQKPRLVSEAAEKLRDLILDRPPHTQIGSLNEVADKLGVGIVTVQQAARILEHEGLLAVKRGPGGGYYGTRPDEAALERSFATYLRIHNIGYAEAFEMTILLDCDMFQAAARSRDPSLGEKITALLKTLNQCETAEDRNRFEVDLRETLFRVVERPLLQMLAHVAWQLYSTEPPENSLAESMGMEEWKKGRERILRAIQQQDEELTDFEAQRYRRMMIDWLRSGEYTGP